MQMQEKEKEEEVFAVERCEDLEGLVKREKKPRSAAADIDKR